MQAGRGVPKDTELKKLKIWCENQADEKGSWRKILIQISAKQTGIPKECL